MFVKHLLFTVYICVFVPSFSGVQHLLNAFSDYADEYGFF